MQKYLERQQKILAKQKKISTAVVCRNSSFDDEICAFCGQEPEEHHKTFRKKSAKTTIFNNNDCNDEALRISHKSSSSLTSVSQIVLCN